MSEKYSEIKQNKKLIQLIKQRPVQEDGKNLSMRIGERLHIKTYNEEQKVWGEIVGFKQGEFILIWFLPSSNIIKNFSENISVDVRGMNVDYQLCGFTTTISKIIIKPHPLIFLKFPNVFEKLHLRRHDRIECFLPAKMILDGNEYKSMIINISKSGARVVLDHDNMDISPEKCEGREMFIVCKNFENDKEVYAKSLVRSANNKDSIIALGVEFIDLIGESHAIIDEYICSIKDYSALKQE